MAPLGLREVFRVFEDAHNLSRITPPWLNFQVLDDHITMAVGAQIHYVIKYQGLPMKWKTVITEYNPPDSFVDLQERGPYKLWHHRHHFVETKDGTVVSDCVDYALPLGPFGRIAHAVMVRRQLLDIFRYRQATMPKLLGVPCRELVKPYITSIDRRS